MNCSGCGRTLVEWEEPTLLVIPPKWWPPNTPYQPPKQVAKHTFCISCDVHDITIETE